MAKLISIGGPCLSFCASVVFGIDFCLAFRGSSPARAMVSDCQSSKVRRMVSSVCGIVLGTYGGFLSGRHIHVLSVEIVLDHKYTIYLFNDDLVGRGSGRS